jgi:hypothetical protein
MLYTSLGATLCSSGQRELFYCLHILLYWPEWTPALAPAFSTVYVYCLYCSSEWFEHTP